tara:strand:- start:8380 stop:8637 length:258 start_codon:yes stop_codon:yes gene_type:complete
MQGNITSELQSVPNGTPRIHDKNAEPQKLSIQRTSELPQRLAARYRTRFELCAEFLRDNAGDHGFGHGHACDSRQDASGTRSADG